MLLVPVYLGGGKLKVLLVLDLLLYVSTGRPVLVAILSDLLYARSVRERYRDKNEFL